MGLANAVQGAKRPSQLITLTYPDGSVVDLTGATITARLRNDGTGVEATSDGAFTVTNAAGGVFRWEYSTTDVATAGRFKVQFNLEFGSAPTPARTFVESWLVAEAI